jgi:hypothetical protein
MFAVTKEEILALSRKYDLTAASVVALGPLESL